jgi:Flp pilus assembly protein TadG
MEEILASCRRAFSAFGAKKAGWQRHFRLRGRGLLRLSDANHSLLSSFSRDERGNIALAFGLSSLMIFTAMGAGVDLSRAYLARQKVSEVATLACQYASRPSVVDISTASYNGTGGGAAYSSQVSAFISTTWQSQNVNLTQTSSVPFSYTQGGASSVNLTASVPTTFMQILGFTQIPISVQTHCFDSAGSVIQRVPDGNSQIMIKESFEAVPGAPNTAYVTYLPNGQNGTGTSATGYTSAVGYTGTGGTQWHITGYCLEQDLAGQIKSTAYDGNYSVELDCDNGSHGAGNSSISTLVYLAAGAYELRYSYASRVDYPSYDPAYLCGSAASDLNWANSSTTSWSGSMATAYRTNQINVYLDLNVNDAPPMHTTLVGNEQLAGGNLIDMCLYGQSWIQRSVQINVTAPGYYWLSFAADGSNDSYGGQLDDILLCNVNCPGTVQDNYTTAWTVSSLLFEDNFESPVYSNQGSDYNTNGNVNKSVGASSYWKLSGSGWGNAPITQLPYWVYECPEGNQCAELGWNSNSLISQSFLLVPGYYQIKYDYVSEVLFSTLGSTVYCGSTPAAANISTLAAASSTGINRVLNVNHGTLKNDTNAVGVFMSHAQEASTPNSGNALGTTTSYTNPDGTTTTTPEVAPNGISLTSYNASQLNPLLDICGYASRAQTRTAVVFIAKPAFYWLTMAALGTSDAFGGQIDDVRITALGSPYASNPPSNAVTIPVPAPQPSTSIYFTGFSISADPLAP